MKKKLITLVLAAALLSSCGYKPQTTDASIPRIAEEIMADMIARTLEAFTLEAAKTPQLEWGFTAPGEQHSVEVTQAPPPQGKAEPNTAMDNSQTGELPESHYIWNILGHRQFFPIGCEASAADDWAKYFGVEVNEFAFQVRLPISDNPDLGFVGDVNGP
ncbi:MAG: hypothetical protein Q8N39_12200 [Pelolinea sp.]|nr:hypothetical protein [Pelolinea sp.]